MKILIDISFLGTRYHGYQVQPSVPTVQGQLNAAAKELFGFECDITGCSRTDSGVHANQFFATITQKGKNSIETAISINKIASAMSVRLPHDISVNNAIAVNDEFHPRYDVKSKEYMYCIWNSKTRNPFLFDRAMQYPFPISEQALENMRLAAKKLEGTHDFSAYKAANSSVENNVRTIFGTSFSVDGDMIRFYISGNGFLYNMVRIITGTLIEVAEGKISFNDIDGITASKNRANAGFTAPAQGLFLNKIIY